jgi:predicted metallopeptidase
MEKVEKSEKLEKIAQDVIKEFSSDLKWLEKFKVAYVYSDKRKTAKGCLVYGECRKCNATMRELSGYSFIITFFEPNVKRFTDEQLHILMYHELLHAMEKNGSPAIVPHDYVVEEFKKIIDKYGVGWDA